MFPGPLMLITVLSLNILSEGVPDAWAAPAPRDVEPRADERDRLETPEPGSGKVLELPGLTEAARRLRSRARPVPGVQPVLAVENLAIGFDQWHSGVDIVDGISFEVHPGEAAGLVGESGCGKSLTALAKVLVGAAADVRHGLLPGPVPSATHPPSGCPFGTRCWKADDVCADTMPDFTAASPPGHRFRCHHPVEEGRPTRELVAQAAVSAPPEATAMADVPVPDVRKEPREHP